KNFGLGCGGKLLFKIPADLQNFRRLTLGHTIIYGRKTLATFPNRRPLDGRRNIILSRTLKKFLGAEIVAGVEDLFGALNVAEDNFVIGGAEIFGELIPYATKIFLTVVNAQVAADVFFPSTDDFILRDVKTLDGFEFRRYTR
ncbi:MAG: dihydrofolate reductase, partial [Selenomonadaceae bacterium]|nr:dihydrofolate reductase [Selenomonadaceae bacterium]